MKTALITGANRGIGFELARQLLGKGWKVILTSRDSHKGQEALATLNNPNASFHVLDVANETSIKVLGSHMRSKKTNIDVLINNAGIAATIDDTRKVSISDVRKVMESNFFGPVLLSQTLLPTLEQSEDGRIINISSGMGAFSDAGRGYAAYRMSKTALNGLTNHMAHDLSGSVCVVAVCPGWVRTELGGANASRSVEDSVAQIVGLIEKKDIKTGKFYRDQEVIDW